jgi:hypothetical protein
MGGEHAELYTYHLYASAIHQMATDGELGPFTEATYEYVDTDREEPFIRLRDEFAGTPLILEIRHEPSKVFFAFALTTDLRIPAAERLVTATGFATATDGTLGRTVPRAEAVAVLLQTVRILRET